MTRVQQGCRGPGAGEADCQTRSRRRGAGVHHTHWSLVCLCAAWLTGCGPASPPAPPQAAGPQVTLGGSTTPPPGACPTRTQPARHRMICRRVTQRRVTQRRVRQQTPHPPRRPRRPRAQRQWRLPQESLRKPGKGLHRGRGRPLWRGTRPGGIHRRLPGALRRQVAQVRRAPRRRSGPFGPRDRTARCASPTTTSIC